MNASFFITTAWLMMIFLSVNASYTRTTTNGEPPIECLAAEANDHALMTGLTCSGGYCGRIAMNCEVPTNRPNQIVGEEDPSIPDLIQHTAWGAIFSEHTPSYSCPNTYFITGLYCRGRNCDDLSVKCTRVKNRRPITNQCKWTGFVSEEQREITFEAGYYATQLECRDSFCDNKRFYTCPIEFLPRDQI